jgi:NAD(P)-dependent dehydrogenase (short-subunit alcohol dehydrogenase family)
MNNVQGKTAFISGGSSGIGLGIARALLAAGMRVAISYRREEHRDSALANVQEHGRTQACAVFMDVTNRESVRAAAIEVERRFGELHVLCNSAGVNLLGPMDEATYDDWDWVLGVNLGGVVNSLVEFLPLIKKHGQGGHVVNVASMASFITGPGFGVYAASKFAVRGLTESLRYTLGRHKIGVSLLCPGLTRSKIYEAPLHRPPHLFRSGVVLDEARIRELAAVHDLGMDADEVGRKTLQGILRNDFYIFSHPEFREEVRQACDEVLRSLPDEESDFPRMVYERLRRKAKEEARALFDELRVESRNA